MNIHTVCYKIYFRREECIIIPQLLRKYPRWIGWELSDFCGWRVPYGKALIHKSAEVMFYLRKSYYNLNSYYHCNTYYLTEHNLNNKCNYN